MFYTMRVDISADKHNVFIAAQMSLSKAPTSERKQKIWNTNAMFLYSFPYNFVPFFVISLLCASFKSYQCRMMNLKEKRVLCFSVNFIISHRQKAQKANLLSKCELFPFAQSRDVDE